MIKLNPRIVAQIGPAYLQEQIGGLRQRYNKEAAVRPAVINPFTGLTVVGLFETGRRGVLTTAFARDLLTGTFDELCSKYEGINHYLLTCKLVHYGSANVDEQLRKASITATPGSRAQYRQDFVARFNNDWLAGLLAQHPHYYESSAKFKRFMKSVSRRLKIVNGCLMKIVDYSYMGSDLRHKILTQIGIEVCPYCNRQYITHYQDGLKARTTADLDHFYPNSVFKLFSLSLYNFIPSCQICNSRFKLAKGSEILYPYDYEYSGDAYFAVKLNGSSTVDTLTGNNALFDLKIVRNGTGSQAAEIHNSIELFNLEQLYQSHKDYVRELLYKQHAYSRTYKQQLEELFADMGLDQFDIHLFLYGNSLRSDEFGKRPLSKLAYDIINRP
ncbi:hypothetical protein PAECIP111893_01851 [Paenibacillus plantiphilus]|uniref:HNH endonuclease n=1 Tax=Paenibacillus plantiphilus TaxID=2905650 RepID=A0ABN8GB55_9BACL|nr:hypothetical protein [Paenibacillus plantiphilus]CAH1202615.1 hypothetical protein PAECIP111893_01851 [Paenibacillus plantiphilus]